MDPELPGAAHSQSDSPAQAEALGIPEASRLGVRSRRFWWRTLLATVGVTGLLVLLDSLFGTIVVAGRTLGPTALLPPLVAVGLALATRRAILSLSLAVVASALVAAAEPLSVFTHLIAFGGEALRDTANLSVLLFALLVMGLVQLLTRTGALLALTNLLVRRVRTRRGAALVPAVMGTALFFDDYANALVVGGASRPLTRRFGISREKLAWIVDSTSAPIAGLVIVSTWIAFEIMLFDAQRASFAAVAPTGWDFFIELLPYRLYCVFAIALVYLVVLSGRDFGPMLRAERRALAEFNRTAPIEPSPTPPDPCQSSPARAWHAALPLALTLLGGLLGATIKSGLSPLDWLLIGAASGALVGTAIVLIFKQLSVRASATSFATGAREILPILVILVLAFALRAGASKLGSDAYLAALCADLSPLVLPIATFCVAAVIAFATGTSWGTMALLIPTMLPLAASLTADMPEAPLLIALTAAAILDGAIFGDHCSLISDTTLISSLASGCPVVDHFRTQAPYALLAMTCASLFGYLGLAFIPGLPVLVSWLVGFAAMTGVLYLVGRRP